jgi:hypothetical protein
MSIRYKILTNTIVFAILAIYMAYRELLVFHSNLFGI